MGRKGAKGSITVFLSLACILFLSLICAVVESARAQGARAQTANVTGMGTFSLLGEFECGLLEKYNIFSLDGAYGSGSFQISKVNDRLKNYISYNANPKKDIFSLWCFDPWNLELSDSSIEGYALLTDSKGEPFYQQAVSYMKTNAAVIAIDKLLEYSNKVDEIEARQKEYEERQKNSDSQMDGLEKERQEKQEELEETGGLPVQVSISNPLKEIAKLRRKSTLEIVTWDKTVSGKKIKVSGLPSRKVSRKGNMNIEKEHSGLTADVLFREYLMMYFSNYLSDESEDVLDYQIEYILGGKDTDKKNLQYVVNRLLLIREGMNYLYCVRNPQISSQTESLALALTGVFAIPALTVATKHALMLAWAYGESLIDVRVLLDNGKVPLLKDVSSWSLSLENLGRITEILNSGAGKGGTGLTYEEYLRILLNMGNISSQRMRALDLIQSYIQRAGANSGFKAENGIVAVKTEVKWKCNPVFFSLPRIVFGASAGSVSVLQQSSMAY